MKIPKIHLVCFALFFGCQTYTVGNFHYMDINERVKDPESQKLISSYCGDYSVPPLSRAMEEQRSGSLQNASILYSEHQLTEVCYYIYSDKEPKIEKGEQ